MNMPYSQKHKFSPSRLLEVKIILNINFDKNELKSVQDKLSSSYQVTQPVGAKVPRSKKNFQKKKNNNFYEDRKQAKMSPDIYRQNIKEQRSSVYIYEKSINCF